MRKKNNWKRRRTMWLSGAIAAVLLFAGCGASGEPAVQSGAAASAGNEAQTSEEAVGIHHAEIAVKNYGTIAVELDGNTAPVTVEHFMDLANDGFYDGLTFHRIIDGFMIQGGDPAQYDSGKTSETIVGEFSANGHQNDISHKAGVISMARANDFDSASSQFFITVADSEFLDGQYAAFGHVTEGLEVAQQIASDAAPVDDNGTITFEEQPVIETVRIID